MATWKKIIVSGSSADLSALSLDTALPVGSGGTGASSLTDGGILLGSGTGAITALGQATNGQIPIGSTGADPVLGTITGGSGIAVTNGAGSITIAADGLGSGTVTSLLFEDGISGGTITTTGTGSLDINSLSTTLSATAATGDLLGIADIDASNATKKITVDNLLKAGTVTIGGTSVGVNGSAVTAFSGLTTLVNDSAVADTSLTGSFTGSFTGAFVGTTDLPDLTDGNGIADFTYDGSTTATVAVEADGSTLSVGSGGVKVADGGITATQIATAVAGAGLAGGGGSALSVNVDDSSIEINTDTLRVKAGGIATSMIAAGAVVSASIAADAVDTVHIADDAVESAQIADNAVTLGTQTTGNYVATLGSGTGVTIGSNTGEGSSPTIAVDYGSSANNAVEGNTTLEVLGTTNEITVTGGGSAALGGGNRSITVALPDDVTIGQDLTVSRDVVIQRNLTVAGTASFQATEDLDVADRFIRMASGSTTNGDGGIVVQQTGPADGEAFAYDSAQTRWGVTGSFDPSTNTIAPDAFMSAVVVGSGGDAFGDVVAKYQKAGNMFVSASGDIYIYS